MSDIEWTDETWNPVSGCTRASPGCDNCYAVVMTRRLAAMGQEAKYGGLVNEGKRHFNGVVRTHEGALDRPFTWTSPRRVFVNSMSDLFHRDVPVEFIDRVFAVMALTPHTYQVLTKRPDRAAWYFRHNPTGRLCDGTQERVAREAQRIASVRGEDTSGAWWDVFMEWWPLPNVHIGASVEDQVRAHERIPDLLSVPAAVRFISFEPLLGPIDLNPFARQRRDGGGIDIQWAIVGGESGPGARPFLLQAARQLVAQCRDAGVPVFVKQLGAVPIDTVGGRLVALTRRPREGYDWRASSVVRHPKGNDMSEWPEDLRVREWPA